MRRVRLVSALLGFLLALAGVALDNRLLAWAAMLVLAVALGLRLWSRRQSRQSGAGEEAGD
jgi:hypothetical protein